MNKPTTNISVSVTKERYQVKTVDNQEELDAAMQLRVQSFHREMAGISSTTNDMTQYDVVGDIMIVRDLELDKTVGCYRVISSTHTDLFYSSQFFDCSEFLALPGTKVEMSRACIDPEYRNGSTLRLLWTGIHEYAQKAKADYVFGCSGVWTNRPEEVGLLKAHLHDKDAVYVRSRISPIVTGKEPAPRPGEPFETNPKKFMPGIMRVYLTVGAKVFPEAAYDPAFDCYLMFTALHLQEEILDHMRK